ncbi:hypothetical protein B0O99DRAFT_670903 [Bisporella sp. PMI_857]|nr:hypothetical protein B0O99DRAFT_670903 [Bisporella sp. PMI_857]
MGSSASRVAKAAPGNVVRKYPTRAPAPQPRHAPKSQHQVPERGWLHAANEASQPSPEARAEPVGADPELAARLQSLGPVQPHPTQSNSSIYNLSTRAPLKDPKKDSTPPSSSKPSYSKVSPSAALAGDPNNPISQFSSQFQPSASNPAQSIFPSRGADPRQNPAVSLLTARYRLAGEADQEFASIGKSTYKGRQFLDVVTIRQILLLRDDKGVPAEAIEHQLGLRPGVVARLGRRGVVNVENR